MVESQGTWPAHWDLAQWTQGGDGLRPTGTLFKGPEAGGLRLRMGDPLVPGEVYYLVALNDIQWPSGLKHRQLALRDNWKAWEMEILIALTEPIRKWCNHLGHYLVETGWKLQLVAPIPLRYSAYGAPVVNAHQRVLIVAQPVLAGVTRHNTIELVAECDGVVQAKIERRLNVGSSSELYFTIFMTSAGNYQVRTTKGYATPLQFLATETDAELNLNNIASEPEPLRVSVASEITDMSLTAYVDGSHWHNIRLDQIRDLVASVDVRCPVPVHLTYWHGEIRGVREQIAAKEATSWLVVEFRTAIDSNAQLRIIIDAGNFGLLRLIAVPSELAQFAPTKVESGDLTPLPTYVLRRARWLAQVIPALMEMEGTNTVRLPRTLRALLSQLSDQAGGETLAHATIVPRLVWPHLRMILQAAERAGWYGPADEGERLAVPKQASWKVDEQTKTKG